MPNTRIPLQIDLKTRDGSIDKDQVITNGFVEFNQSNQKITTKRPGIAVEASGSAGGTGVFYYNGNVYQWVLGGNTTPTILPISFLGGRFWFGSLYSAVSPYLQNQKVIAIDPYDGQAKAFFTNGDATDNLGNRSTIPDPTTEPNTPGSLYWSTVTGTSTTAYANQAAALAAANAFRTAALFLPTPQGSASPIGWAGFKTVVTVYGPFATPSTIAVGNGAGTTFNVPANCYAVGYYIRTQFLPYPSLTDNLVTAVIFKY
jgi:hypothetical protein